MEFSQIKDILISRGPFINDIIFAPTISMKINYSDEIDYYNLSIDDKCELIKWSKTHDFNIFKRKTLWRNLMKEVIMEYHTRNILHKK